ncbi:MAG: hypothetical protein AAF675_16750 [Pseudomonadota bacterium]
MILVLIGTVAIGLGSAGILFLTSKVTGVKPPTGVAPIAAGIAMFAFMLWNEYSWFDRAQDGLPAGAAVADTIEHSSVFQPWTMAIPRVVRFAAIDAGPSAAAAAAPTHPGLLRADVILAERFGETLRLPHLFDCTGSRRAALPATDALPGELDWVISGTDPLIKTACATATVLPADRENGDIL